MAYDLLNARDYRSYGYMLAQGATTIWEIWQHKTGPRNNSYNRPRRHRHRHHRPHCRAESPLRVQPYPTNTLDFDLAGGQHNFAVILP